MDAAFEHFFLKKNEFRNASAQSIHALLSCSDQKNYAKNELIYSPDDAVQFVYLIEKGSVELFSYSPNRLQKKTFSVLNRGSIFGYGELSEKTHVLYALSMVKSSLYRVTIKDFLDTVTADRALSRDFFLSYSHQISQFQKTLLMETAQLKVINYLNWLAESSGKKIDEGIALPRKQTYEQIGNILFLSRETVIRTLQTLEEEGILSVQKKNIILFKPEVISGAKLLERKNFFKI
jgi:CRP/FNR family transcriptional regulator